MAKSDYLEAKYLNHTLRNVAYTAPAAVYAALMTATPTDTGGGTEVAGGSYARQAITFGATTNGTISNSAIITFSAVPAATITHVAVYDALTSGNLLYYGALTSSIITTDGSDVQFTVGQFVITED